MVLGLGEHRAERAESSPGPVRAAPLPPPPCDRISIYCKKRTQTERSSLTKARGLREGLPLAALGAAPRMRTHIQPEASREDPPGPRSPGSTCSPPPPPPPPGSGRHQRCLRSCGFATMSLVGATQYFSYGLLSVGTQMEECGAARIVFPVESSPRSGILPRFGRAWAPSTAPHLWFPGQPWKPRVGRLETVRQASPALDFQGHQAVPTGRRSQQRAKSGVVGPVTHLPYADPPFLGVQRLCRAGVSSWSLGAPGRGAMVAQGWVTHLPPAGRDRGGPACRGDGPRRRGHKPPLAGGGRRDSVSQGL